MSTTERLVRRGPVELGERSLAPDLARGLMLLLIALANTPWFLYGAAQGISTVHAQGGTPLDQIVQIAIITAVDGRVYPMFAFLFGYGMVQLHRRQIAAGTDDRTARRVLRRRNLWLIVFGFVDAALFWMGDVLAAYGLAGLILVALFFRRRDRTLLVWAAIWSALLFLAMLLAIIGSFFAASAPAAEEPVSFLEFVVGVNGIPVYTDSVLPRLGVWAVLTPVQGLLGLVVPTAIVLAFWAARHEILERPAEHLPLLRRVAVIGIAVGWLGGLPHALEHAGALPVPDQVSWVFSTSQGFTGLLAGLGYVALFGLIGSAIRRRGSSAPGVGVQALTAVGRRSLSCYLAQSVAFALLFSSWALGLGGWVGSAGAALVALAVWVLTVIGAWLLDRAGRRGPAEVLLRRLVYRRGASKATVSNAVR